MIVRVSPCLLSGTVQAIPSKSDAHRALIAAALADAPTRVTFARGDAFGADVRATIGCLSALGASILHEEGAFFVKPCSPLGAVTLDCGESGSTLRFLLPVAAALTDGYMITGRGRLPERPLEGLLDALAAHGCTIHGEAPEGSRYPRLPFTVSGPLKGGASSLPGNVSSQFVSGLLLSAPLLDTDTRIEIDGELQSAGYVDMTLRTMRAFGAAVEALPDGYLARAGGYRTSGAYRLDGDWSNAAVFLAAGSMGHAVRVSGLDASSAQPDRCCEALLSHVGGGNHIDVSGCPDLVPVLAARAAMAKGETHFDGAARLRLKESDRLSAIAEGLTALGSFVTERPDGLTVHGGGIDGGEVSAYGDHRMVMAWTLAAIGARRSVVIDGAEAVEKSYPSFFEDFERLGGRCDVIA